MPRSRIRVSPDGHGVPLPATLRPEHQESRRAPNHLRLDCRDECSIVPMRGRGCPMVGLARWHRQSKATLLRLSSTRGLLWRPGTRGFCFLRLRRCALCAKSGSRLCSSRLWLRSRPLLGSRCDCSNRSGTPLRSLSVLAGRRLPRQARGLKCRPRRLWCRAEVAASMQPVRALAHGLLGRLGCFPWASPQPSPDGLPYGFAPQFHVADQPRSSRSWFERNLAGVKGLKLRAVTDAQKRNFGPMDQQVHELVLTSWIQGSGPFIEHYDIRLVEQDAGERQALLLAS